MTTTLADNYQYRKLSNLTMAVLIGLLVDAGTTLAVLIGYINIYRGFTSPKDPMPFKSLDITMRGMDVIHSFEWFLTIVVLALFLFWIHRAFANLFAWKVEGLTYTPKSAVKWWFIPGPNLYKPYAAMCELWRASNADAESTNWSQSRKNWLILGWWICLWSGLFLYQFGHFALADYIRELLQPNALVAQSEAAWRGRIGGALLFVSGAFVLRIAGMLALALAVSTIADDHEARNEKLASTSGETPTSDTTAAAPSPEAFAEAPPAAEPPAEAPPSSEEPSQEPSSDSSSQAPSTEASSDAPSAEASSDTPSAEASSDAPAPDKTPEESSSDSSSSEASQSPDIVSDEP